MFGDQHVGIVENLLPNGSIQTIEGNFSSQVSRVIRGPGEATGYVRLWESAASTMFTLRLLLSPPLRLACY